MAGVTSFLFQGAPVPGVPTASDSSQSFPLWLQQYVANTAGAAANVAQTPYTPFPGQEVASPSDATQRSWDMALGGTGQWQPNLGWGEALTGVAGTPVNESDIQGFMSPYLHNVVGALADESNRNLFNNLLPGVESRYISAGQSRSPQEMQMTANIVRDQQKGLNDATAGVLQSGYQGALNAALATKQQQQTAGAQIGQLGALRQQLGAADTGQVAATGQAQDMLEQKRIDADRSNFNAQQQWPYQNLAFLSNIIRGLPVNSNQQTVGLAPATSSAYSPSPLASFLGTAVGAKGLGFRAGGEVAPRRRRGGK